MAKRTITADEYRCNNPSCPTVVLATKDDPPEGADNFFDWVHPENGTVCPTHVGKTRSVTAKAVRRFEYMGPMWLGGGS